jgi:transposase-like protein
MATIQQFTLTSSQRRSRYFSEEFKKKKVREIEKNLVEIKDLCKEYEVSRTSVYNWIYKYSAMKKKGTRQVVEAESDTKKIKALKEQIKLLEQSLGQKQILIDFQSKVIDLAEEEYKIDIKKKFGDKPYSGSGTTGDSTR